MWITPAYAQAAGQAGGDMFGLLMPMIVVFGIMYFLMIRPQQKRQKEHQAKLAAAKRGDKVITGGGIKGTVRKVSDDGTLTVEISKDVQIEVVGSTLMDVIVKGDPQSPAQQNQAPKGLFSGLFGGGAKSPAPKAEAAKSDDAASPEETGKDTGKETKTHTQDVAAAPKKSSSKKTKTAKASAKKSATDKAPAKKPAKKPASK